MNDSELIKIIKNAAYQVRRAFTAGYLESVYQNALMVELQSRGLRVEKEAPIVVSYKDHVVGDFRADLIVEKRIILELKAVKELIPIHEVQLINYLVATGLDYGVLINYGSEKYSFRVKTRIYDPGAKYGF